MSKETSMGQAEGREVREAVTKPSIVVRQSSHPVAGDFESGAQSTTSTEHIDRHRIGPFSLPTWYSSPKVQTCMIGLVFFLTIVMFNAMTSLGGGGQDNPTTFNTANMWLYITFSVSSLASGPLCDLLGLRLTLSFGGIGYAIFAGAFWYYNN